MGRPSRSRLLLREGYGRAGQACHAGCRGAGTDSGRRYSSPKRMKLKALKWSLRAIRGESNSLKGKVAREIGLTLFSTFYAGNLVASRQEHWEKKLGLEAGIFTRYSSTRGYGIFTGLEYFGVFELMSPILDLIPGYTELKSTTNAIDLGIDLGFWGHAAISGGINLWRYTLSRSRGARIPSPSLYTLGINGLDFGGLGIAKTAKKYGPKIKTLHKKLEKPTLESLKYL